MKSIRSIVVIAGLLAGHSAYAGEFSFTYTRSELCSQVSAIYFTSSSHPGGDRHGALNESNRGFAGRCQFEKDGHITAVMGGLYNSQFGNSFLFGPGVKYRLVNMPEWTSGMDRDVRSFLDLIQVSRLSLDVGLDLPWIYYEHPRRHAYYYGFLPVPYYRLNYKLPGKWGELGFNTNYLANTNIRLRSIEWNRQF